jgi:hypothetical protein
MARVLFDHIQLQGSAGFIVRTQPALVCLRTAPSHAEVWALLAVLRKGKRSGVHADRDRPVIDVGQRIWNSPTIWYASGIAHEGFHIKLYREAKMRNGGDEPKVNTWGGAEAEKKCLEFQLRVLQELKAPNGFLEYVRQLMKSPNYQGDPSSFKDYMRRDW